MSLEGELRLRLRLAEGRIQQLQLSSTRPDLAQTLLQGRRRAEVQAAVPRLFSICARSQALACELACAVAAGEALEPACRSAVQAALAAETVRETSWQALLQWPRALGEPPAADALAAARAAHSWAGPDAGDAACAQAQGIAQALFGEPAARWLQRDSWAELGAWSAAGSTATARYVQRLGDAPPDTPATRDLPTLSAPTPQTLSALAAAAADDPAFSRQPLWQGRPAETGALARLHADALVGLQAAPAPSRVRARHVARLRELAHLLAGQARPGLGALQVAPDSGVAWVDNARGLLLHHVQLEGDRVRLYRIVAPTEWNFHPQGALSAALQGLPVATADEARQRAEGLINSLDPCVACHVEVETQDA